MTRLAIIGAGVIAAKHSQACRPLSDVRITWVADLDRRRAETLAATCGARATENVEAAVSAPDVDAVIVAVPTPHHRVVTELAAAHGKHVLCEKPLARTIEDTEAMIAACARAGVRLMVGHVVRFFPEYARLRQALREDAIGRVGLVRAMRVGPDPRGSRPWFADFAASGGVILDLMIHEFDLLRWWFGDVARIYVSGVDREEPDFAQALLRFASGTIAHVEASWRHAVFRTAIEIAGEHGILRHDSEASAALRLEPTVASASTVVHRGADPDEPWRLQLAYFRDRLADGAPFLVDGDEGARSVELGLAALASIRTDRPVVFAAGRPPRAEIAA